MKSKLTNLEVGQIINIEDFQAITDSMNRKKGVKGIDYVVLEHKRIEAFTSDFKQHIPITYYIYELEDSSNNELLKLIVKEIELSDSEIVYESVIYFSPNCFNFYLCDRKYLYDNDQLWIFSDPGKEDYKLCEMPYAEKLDSMPTTKKENTDEVDDFLYEMKMSKTIFGLRETEDDYIDYMITEYDCKDDKCKNPRFIIIESVFLEEEGNNLKDNGGILSLMFGSEISESEVTVY